MSRPVQRASGLADRWIGSGESSPRVSTWTAGTAFRSEPWLTERLGGMPAVLGKRHQCRGARRGDGRCRPAAQRVFYTNSGSGIGGGFVVDGGLYHGRGPGEMELGHLRLGPEGGILEDVASGWAIDSAALRLKPPSIPTGRRRLVRPAGPRRRPAMFRRPRRREMRPPAESSTRRPATMLALSHMTHLLNPDVVVLGGGVAEICARRGETASRVSCGAFSWSRCSPGPTCGWRRSAATWCPWVAALVALQAEGRHY